MADRKLLLVAYHFPPIQGSTGTSRTVAFARYLCEFGWRTCVLTVQPGAYENTAVDNELLVPDHVLVERAWGVDTRRQLALFGRYLLIFALPDRWQSWILGGYFRGVKATKAWRPNVIMSTYPIPSAHVIGYLLSRRFGIPWIAEFRDPMLQPDYPASKLERWAFKKVEKLVFENAARIVVTTDGCKRLYSQRYPDFGSDRILTISNGFDTAIFPDSISTDHQRSSNRLVLLHSGLLYPHERNPTNFFNALKALADDGFLAQYEVEFRFRASGNEESYRQAVADLGIDQYVRFLPRIPYQQAVEEMLQADALMIFQADNCNDQIPAKVYEYLYSQKPVLGFADPGGETGRFLASVGVPSIAKLEDRQMIEKTIRTFLPLLISGNAFVVPQNVAMQFSRQSLTADLGKVLDELTDQPGNSP